MSKDISITFLMTGVGAVRAVSRVGKDRPGQRDRRSAINDAARDGFKEVLHQLIEDRPPFSKFSRMTD